MRRRSNKYKVPQLSDAEYFAQLKAQNGGCWICGRKPKERRLAGDHSHYAQALGKLVRRGLLCYCCNRFVVGAVERFKINPERLALYFRTFPDR